MEITKVIIGLEVHVELRTDSKMFCGCPADHFAKQPNTQTCPVCLGLPGALPVPNKKAVEWTILLGSALNCEIPRSSRFDRKNYFYPDLPKGYQISQYQNPFAIKGSFLLGSGKTVYIRRVHLEEDTAKLLHETVEGEKVSLIDFNRSGVALVEIVTEPDMNSSDEAKEYLEKLQQLVRYLGISDTDMEKGSMRCEPNVNLEIRDDENTFFTPIAELKNINSFRFVKKAIDYETKRQFAEFGEKRIQKAKGNKQTRGWDEDKQITFPQREKEEANDYRYFPEPDIPPIEWSDEQITNYKLQITKYELPWTKKQRFVDQYGLSDYQAKILTDDKKTADFFDECLKIGNVDATVAANVIINKKAPSNLTPRQIADFILSSKIAPKVSNEEIDQLIEKLLKEHPETVEGYKKGKPQALGLIVGQVKKNLGVIVSVEKITGKIK